ncbi:MAG: hypothetical protein BRC41_17550, partial [Cyanobacteria bacterium QH_9_48_43]
NEIAKLDEWKHGYKMVYCHYFQQLTQVIIMDHAPFQNSKTIPALMEHPGCELWYLPNYSRLFPSHRALVVNNQDCNYQRAT